MEPKPKKLINPGEIWQLGDHRIACGDSSDVELINKLIGTDKVRQILTDPPFGVSYATKESQEFRKIKSGWDEIKADGLQTDEEYSNLTKKWLEAVKGHLDDYNTFYIFNSDSRIVGLIGGIRAAEFRYSQLVIWVKNSVIIGMKDHLSQHELIAYGWYEKHKMERSKAKSVMFYPKPHRSKLHPTMKPVGLLRQLIQNSTRVGDTVYDPFGGSGSTLIACEQFRRKCLMVEIEPEYVSTTIMRWEILTGKEAVKL
jgi:DNA modification methylase